MAAANHSIVQSPAPQVNVANALPPPAPGNAAGPAGGQLPANVAHVVQVDPLQGAATANHPAAEAAPELIGAGVAGPLPLPLGLGMSPLSSSLYGWLFGN
ncbi:hypothetical protein RSOLAG22IIIB_11307 [Rhizoctonia solani]|uniref:Uncharacterized protein n=1 Tax=Rhizoctonia solani TaxID=456999 RepID=A0A0K6G7X1_9AGAM|nr:hypothetical protein RSOLAG22IIIB_11307 [Rhizoctonia solani]